MPSMHDGKQYREKALKMYPWVCGRCGRDFEGKQIRELTVHHRDHNHSNNPADGSNWELLCVYCHDNEHQRFLEADSQGALQSEEEAPATYNAFAGLKDLLKAQKKQ
ncbi:MAG: YajD family HNH nuclease [Mariprofundaceae bacterium]|nr:YajD family HNH nuclease [Mariprofundaceae bacterium]